MYVDKSKTYIGIVEENQDPKKLGRCRVRVVDIFDEIPVEDIPWASPWKDLNGNSFNVPEKGKIVTVVFDSGNIYKPEYVYADHYNINLEKKLQSLNGSNYTSMKSLIFDHKTQIYVNDEEGLKLDHKFNNINIKSSEINLNLKDNFAKVNIGSANARQQAILGNHFLNWFDEFIDNLLGLKGGPFIGNLGFQVTPNPAFMEVCLKYQSLKNPKFLSHHINLVDNEYVDKLDRVNDPQTGDTWKSTVKENGLFKREKVNYQPIDGISTDTPNPPVGDLTTSSDPVKGVENENNIAPEPGPIQPSNNPDVPVIIATMKQKGYEVFEKPYQMNIVGIRRQYEGMKYSNQFVDDLYLLFKVDNTEKWQIKKYACSTMPGYFKALEVEVKTKNGFEKKLKTPGYKLKSGERFIGNTQDGNPIDLKATSIIQSRGGLGILKNNQHKNIYEIGTHAGLKALKTRKGQTQEAYRDDTVGNIIKYTKETKGQFSMHIHRGFAGGVSVNNWSEGCQVFSKESDLNDFFNWLEKHREKWGNVFHYTLMLERDLVSQEKAETVIQKTNTNTGTSNATTVPDNSASINKYNEYVKSIDLIYRLADKNFTSNFTPLFEDFKSIFGDDEEGAFNRLKELFGISTPTRASFWTNKLPLTVLNDEHKQLFLQQLELLRQATISGDNLFNFKLPVQKKGEPQRTFPINSDF